MDRLPEQEGRATEVVEAGIGAAVLINERVLVSQCDDARARLAVLSSDADLEGLAQTRHEIAEPVAGLRRQLVSSTRQ